MRNGLFRAFGSVCIDRRSSTLKSRLQTNQSIVNDCKMLSESKILSLFFILLLLILIYFNDERFHVLFGMLSISDSLGRNENNRKKRWKWKCYEWNMFFTEWIMTSARVCLVDKLNTMLKENTSGFSIDSIPFFFLYLDVDDICVFFTNK